MAVERWTLVRDIFEDAARLGPDERSVFLEKACDGDPSLLDEIRSLLVSHDSSDSFLETPAGDILMKAPATTPRLENGDELGHYRIVETLGSGGVGEVYLATDQKLGRNVAIKVLSARFNRDEVQLKRFVREAKAASGLNHPNILVIHEFGETGDARFIVSEFIDGKTLREIMKDGSLPFSNVLQIATQIANALSAAHAVNLVHRDIKPENIMVRPDGYVKVLDFGLAKLVERTDAGLDGLAAMSVDGFSRFAENPTLAGGHTATGMILGTLNYMSPEQAKGESIDKRTDIFSFGVLLYEMIAGRTPFAADSVAGILDNLVRANPEPVSRFAPSVPDELERLISKCIEKDRDSRYQSMEDILSDLGSVANSSPSKRGTSNEEAYWLYLQGKNLTATHFPNDARAAVEYFTKAAELDPGFARAYAGLAQALFIASHGGGGSQAELNEQAKQAVARAIEIDNTLGEAHAVFGEIAFAHDWDLAVAERYLRRSVELEPASELGHAVYGEYLATRGRFDEAVSEIKTALEIDPKSCANQIIYGRILYFARRYEDAIVQFKRVIEVFPSWTTAYGWIWLTLEMMGETDKAFEWLITNQERNNVTTELIADYKNAYVDEGWLGVGRRLLEIEKPQGPSGNFYALARHAIRVGDHELALNYLERSYEAHQYQMTWLDVDPYFDPVRTDPSFTELIERVGLV